MRGFCTRFNVFLSTFVRLVRTIPCFLPSFKVTSMKDQSIWIKETNMCYPTQSLKCGPVAIYCSWYCGFAQFIKIGLYLTKWLLTTCTVWYGHELRSFGHRYGHQFCIFVGDYKLRINHLGAALNLSTRPRRCLISFRNFNDDMFLVFICRWHVD